MSLFVLVSAWYKDSHFRHIPPHLSPVVSRVTTICSRNHASSSRIPEFYRERNRFIALVAMATNKQTSIVTNFRFPTSLFSSTAIRNFFRLPGSNTQFTSPSQRRRCRPIFLCSPQRVTKMRALVPLSVPEPVFTAIR